MHQVVFEQSTGAFATTCHRGGMLFMVITLRSPEHISETEAEHGVVANGAAPLKSGSCCQHDWLAASMGYRSRRVGHSVTGRHGRP